MFIKVVVMNYTRIYDNLVNSRRNRVVQEGEYYETHHIVPRSMGGDNSASNLIKLTAREHYVAHRLLYHIHKNSKMAAAWLFMCNGVHGGRIKYTGRQYAAAREAHSNHMKISMKGKGNHFYGKKHTAETKRLISAANTGKKRTLGMKEAISRVHKGVPKSKEHRAKLGKKARGMIVLRNIITLEIIWIPTYTRSLYSKNIWLTAAAASRKLGVYEDVECPHCGKKSQSNNSAFMRWHFDNCTSSPNYVKPAKRTYNVEKCWSPWYNKPMEHSSFVYNKLFEIEQIVLANTDLSGKKAMTLLMSKISTAPEHRYYIMACRKAILKGMFDDKSKQSLMKYQGEL